MNSTRYNSVMLIDDNELDNFVNKKLIESENFAGKIQVEQSAINAIEHLKKASGEQIPDVIFLDIMMPDMDGFGFLAEFEKLGDHIKKQSKIVMLSTSESFKDLNKANQNRHVYKFLNKPLTKPVLDALNI